MNAEGSAFKRWGGQSGLTTLELLIALSLAILLGAALLGLTVRIIHFRNVSSLLIAREELLQTVPAVFSRTLTGAGNGIDPLLALRLSPEISALADVDGSNGFPDGTLGQPFESVRFRVQDDRLQWASGGGSFQTLLEGVAELRGGRPNPRLIRLNVTTVTEVVPGLGHPLSGVESTIQIWLWNYRPSLFAARVVDP